MSGSSERPKQIINGALPGANKATQWIDQVYVTTLGPGGEVRMVLANKTGTDDDAMHHVIVVPKQVALGLAQLIMEQHAIMANVEDQRTLEAEDGSVSRRRAN